MREHLLKSDDFLVSQTDEKGIIMFANDDFCKTAGYTIDELVGKPHNIVRNSDMPRAAFKDLWSTVKADKVWNGYVKNATKDGGFYWVYATVYPKYDSQTNSKSYISCRRKASLSEIETAQNLYKTLR
ncbi:MAG: PAS domain-containing protein [Campylobacterota bacterium]